MRRKPVASTSYDPEFIEAAADRQHTMHRLNSRACLDISSDEAARMVAEFAASRGITKCKPAYAALSPHYRV